MNYTTAHILFFSPTHTSAKIARAIAKGTGVEQTLETDLTYDSSNDPIVIKNELVILSVPVYAGRVAPVALERINRLRGENAPIILAVVYGNRDYEDALVELRDMAVIRGFIPLSAGAFIGEHSYSRKDMPIAEGRPDSGDIYVAESFGKESVEKMRGKSGSGSLSSFYIKGNVPYREVAPSTPAAPLTSQEACGICGECIICCPTNAICVNNEGLIETNKMKCIKCCACVKECPNEARIFDTPYTAMLRQKCSVARLPELFL